MANVVVYSKDYCPYCVKAKNLLQKKGAAFTEIDLSKNPEKMAEMLAQSGGRKSVPQIFIGSTHVGGCDDLYALDAQGKLDALLKG